MLCDRDALPMGKAAASAESKAAGKLRVLGRYHLENYFLDEQLLATIFADWEPEGSWLRDPKAVLAKLEQIATGLVPYATALIVSAKFREQFGNLDLMVKGSHGKTLTELSDSVISRAKEESVRFSASIEQTVLEQDLAATHKALLAALGDGSWKNVIPGRSIVEQFAMASKVPSGRLKLRYLAESERTAIHPFQDVLNIFKDFANQ